MKSTNDVLKNTNGMLQQIDDTLRDYSDEMLRMSRERNKAAVDRLLQSAVSPGVVSASLLRETSRGIPTAACGCRKVYWELIERYVPECAASTPPMMDATGGMLLAATNSASQRLNTNIYTSVLPVGEDGEPVIPVYDEDDVEVYDEDDDVPLVEPVDGGGAARD